MDLYISLFTALLCGSIIGIERELKKKDAGLKTNIFICIGAALFSFLGLSNNTGDQYRVLSQIVSGVGFIGAGVIIYQKNRIQGLTSAALIWLTAAIGSMAGMGMYFQSISISVVIVVIEYISDNLKGYFKNHGIAAGRKTRKARRVRDQVQG